MKKMTDHFDTHLVKSHSLERVEQLMGVVENEQHLNLSLIKV